MTSRIEALCVSALEPAGLARFWAGALGWEVAGGRGGDGAVLVVPTDGCPVAMRFVPTTEPKMGKNHAHLDLSSATLADQADAVDRMLALGARPVDVGQAPDDIHVVLADPEGNELCILEPGNSFVDSRSRFGSITCDGSRAAGVFWSAALGWPLVWDQDEETAVRAPDGTGPFVTWGPPVPSGGRSRLHLDLVPVAPATVEEEVERLVVRGATVVGPGPGGRLALADPDGVPFRLGPGPDVGTGPEPTA